MKDLVCCVDMGTSRIKAALLDATGGLRAVASAPSTAAQRRDQPAEFDADTCFVILSRTIRAALRQVRGARNRIAAVAVASQRATVVPVGPDGRPAGHALSWQDTRGESEVRRFLRRFGRARFTRITGLPPGALWSLSKILWFQREHPGAAASARYVLLHDYVLCRLGAHYFVTDPSNASLTGLFDTHRLAWSEPLVRAAGLAPSRLPVLAAAGSQAGRVSAAAARATGLKAGTPLVVGGGDQQCAALGIGALDPGQASLCLGTAAVVACPVRRPAIDPRGRFFCTVHAVRSRWVLEGIHNTFGACIRWARTLLQMNTGDEFLHMARKSRPGAKGLLFLPFLAGIGTPDFDARTRAAMLGMGLSHRIGDIARAILEGTSLELRRVVAALEQRVRARTLIVTGGEIARPLRMQVLADLLGRNLLLNRTPDATLVGTAILAWTGAGRFRTVREAAHACSGRRAIRVNAMLPAAESARYYRRYGRAVAQLRRMGATDG